MRRSLLVWTVDTDPDATRAVYRNVPVGAALRCGCMPCQNFHAARPSQYPDPLRELLASAAIEPVKEASVRLVSPLEGDLHLYAGTYAFCGDILAGRPYRGFPFVKEEVDVFERVAPGVHVALRPWQVPEGPWAGRPCVRLEFLVALPWVLGDTGTPAVNLDRGPGRVTS